MPAPGPLFASDLAPPGPLRRVRGTPRGTLELAFEHATGELAVARDGSVRLRLAPGSVLPPELGPCLGREPWPIAAIDARARSTGGFVVACGSAELAPSIEIDSDPFVVRIALHDLGPLATLDRFRLRAEPGAARLGGGEVCLHSPPREPLVVEVAPGADGAFTLIEDDGITPDGSIAATRLRVSDRRGDRLRLEIARREGDYSIAVRDLRVCLRGTGVPRVVLLDGERLVEGQATPGYRIERGRVQVRLRDAGEVHTVEVEPAP